MKMKLHRKFAGLFGYDVERFKQQINLERNLSVLFMNYDIDLVIDVGANEGQYARMLRGLGYKGEIISFEPIASIFTHLEKNAGKDDKWRAIRCALSNQVETVKMKLLASSDFSSLHDVKERGKKRFGEAVDVVNELEVTTRRLDDMLFDLVPDFESRNVFLKMDTQGHDRWVFEGAGDFADQFVGLQSELSVVGIYEEVPDYVEMLTYFRSFGYELAGLYVISRAKKTGHIVELDCVMVAKPDSWEDSM